MDKVGTLYMYNHSNLYDSTNAQCTCTVGVENNNIAKGNYFSSNLHDLTGEVLKAEWRQEQTEKYKRNKRSYTKYNLKIWEKEINETKTASYNYNNYCFQIIPVISFIPECNSNFYSCTVYSPSDFP